MNRLRFRQARFVVVALVPSTPHLLTQKDLALQRPDGTPLEPTSARGTVTRFYRRFLDLLGFGHERSLGRTDSPLRVYRCDAQSFRTSTRRSETPSRTGPENLTRSG